jgi:hypothetical protein
MAVESLGQVETQLQPLFFEQLGGAFGQTLAELLRHFAQPVMESPQLTKAQTDAT